MPVTLIKTRRHEDERGWFVETWAEAGWASQGVEGRFVQDNHSFSLHPGTIRGFHFQQPPHAQGKLVRCVRGRMMDYAVDLRHGSPTYGRHVSAELSVENGCQLWIPVGFGHAFVTLEPRTEVAYKVTGAYAPDSEYGIAWDDPDLAIDWPLPPAGPVLSDKDRSLPKLADFVSPFSYDGRPLELLEDRP